jgi:hypothetical protein
VKKEIPMKQCSKNKRMNEKSGGGERSKPAKSLKKAGFI